MLETCATADEARRSLSDAPQYYETVPCHYIIADRGGDSFVWSHAARPGRPIRIDGSRDKPLAITNHIPDPVIAEGPPRMESIERLTRLCAAVDASGERPGLDAIRRSATTVAATLPPGAGQYRAASPTRTLWHAFYDLQDCSVEMDFYLGDEQNGTIRRSTPRRFTIRRNP